MLEFIVLALCIIKVDLNPCSACACQLNECHRNRISCIRVLAARIYVVYYFGPGTLQLILGRRGNPRLIVDGYAFYKKSVYKGKAFWYCKNSRSADKCPSVAWTMNGNIVKWPCPHNHVIFPDPFNPEEDSEVPLENLQEVLWQTSLS